MNQKEKLSEMIKDWNFDATKCNSCNRKHIDCLTCSCMELAEYLLQNGVIVLPCKVGDMVYVVCPVQGITEQKVKRFQLGSYGLMFATGKGVRPVDDFGKTVFLTREEAEMALAERNKLNV